MKTHSANLLTKIWIRSKSISFKCEKLIFHALADAWKKLAGYFPGLTVVQTLQRWDGCKIWPGHLQLKFRQPSYIQKTTPHNTPLSRNVKRSKVKISIMFPEWNTAMVDNIN